MHTAEQLTNQFLIEEALLAKEHLRQPARSDTDEVDHYTTTTSRAQERILGKIAELESELAKLQATVADYHWDAASAYTGIQKPADK